MTRKSSYFMITLLLLIFVFLLFGCSSAPETLEPTIEPTPSQKVMTHTSEPVIPTVEEITSTPETFIVWSDDFEDGDYDGWETWWQKGLYSADDGVLSIKTGGDLFHESTVLYGTWGFDLYIDNNLGTTHEFRFTEGTFNFQNLEVKQDQNTQIWITTQRDGEEVNSSHVDLGEKLTGWHHFDITKDESGLVRVYLDSVFLFEHFDDREFDSEKLVIMYCCDGPVLDNVVIRDEVIEIKPIE